MKLPDEDVSLRVVRRINSYFEDGAFTLDRVAQCEQKLEKEKAEIENRLARINSSISHELQDLLKSGEELESRVAKLTQDQDTLLVAARETASECRQFGLENREILSDIQCVRGVTQYTLWLRLVEQVYLDLSVSLETKDKDQIVLAYTKLRDVKSALGDSKCSNLVNYVDEVIVHWFTVLRDTYTTSLQSSLNLFGWPFVDQPPTQRSVSDLLKVGSEDIRTLQDSVEILLRLHDPAEDGDRAPVSPSLPLKVLLKPLRKRFKFHFLGTKSTNNPAKPEWFTTQLSTWALTHRKFLNDYLQPVYDKVKEPTLVISEFAQGLISMAVEKLCVDIPIVLEDDVLFAHTIDEVIGFARDMNTSMQYSSTQPSVLQPLTVQGIFSRWLNMERKFAFEKVDNLFMEPGASVWESEVGDSYTPRAAETFLALLLSVTERYKFLSLPQHRIEFLKLQIDLIEDFRVRLVQLGRTEKVSPLSSNLCPIINTLEHLVLVLGNWSETPFFLQLQFQKSSERTQKLRAQMQNSPKELNKDRSSEKDNSEGSRISLEEEKNAGDKRQDLEEVEEEEEMEKTVFEESIEELKYFKKMLIVEVVDSIFYTVTARSLKYRTETRWFSMVDAGKTVSPAVCEMLQSLAFSLDTARTRVNPAAFQLVWRQLASRLHMYIIEEVVLQNKFCMEGAIQLEVDINLGFFPIFGEFTPTPQAYFSDLMDIVKLLTSQPGPLHLVYEGLTASCEEGASNILRDLGVHRLSRERALRVLQLRIDLAC